MKFLRPIKFFGILILCLCNKTYAQRSQTYGTRINKANNVYIGNNISDVQKANIMLITKYIKKDKPIRISAGITFTFTYESIKKGSTIYGGDAENIIKVKAVGNNLFISSRVKSIDQKVVAVIKDNKLLVGKGLIQRSSENFIEIIDDYDIPVLQVIINKDNSIEINGVFFTESACYILNKKSLKVRNFKPFAMMDESERQKALFIIRQEASLIKAIE